ncbi:fatty-acid-CoA ligase [Achlya hypogyna]|uniref:Fatty-acid-CoA ligase n=1 Tax=Achlya hypogyna TaxID=1202772 RepID=A0A1V9Z9Z4_ACHHY|nr:fatty-acid-CoA ligase [Achlya hypogyna]
MQALALSIDAASAAVATSLAAVALGTAAYLTSRKRKHEDVIERGLPTTASSARTNEDQPAPKAKRARTTKAPDALASEASIVDLLRRRAEETPDKVVYVFLDDAGKESVSLTFADVDRAARRVAATLQTEAGLQKGDRVMLCYPPGLDFAMGFWGCLYAGAIGIPVYPPYPGTLVKDLPKFNRMVEDSGAKVILTNRAYYMATQLATAKSFFSGAVSWPKDILWYSTDAISTAMTDRYTDVACTFDDIAFFQYSSGSTSEPKAVMVSHGNIHAQLKTWASICDDDTLVSWLPSYHDMGLVGFILVPCATGARCISMSPLAFIKDPALWMRTVSKYKGTHVCAPNFGYALAARKTTKAAVAKLDLRSLKQCICAAEPIRVESLEAFTEKFLPAGFDPKTFNCGYGLAEVTLVVTGQDPHVRQDPTVLVLKKSALEQRKAAVVAPKGHNPTDTVTLVGCGGPMPTFRVIVVDPETHVQLKDNAVGEIWIQGPSVAQGYWHREEYTKEQFRATLADPKRKRASLGSTDKSHFLRSGDVSIVDKSHWLRSGDMGFLRNGQTFITGRLKDLIIVRGRNVCPQDVEHTVETASADVRPGCVAAFSIETSQQEEALVVVAELRADLKKLPERLRAIASAVATAVLGEHQLRCASIVLLRPRSIPKTTSGKIQRRGTKAQFEAGTLAAQFTLEGPPPAAAPVSAVVESSTAEPTAAEPAVGQVVRTPEEIVAWLLERLAQEHAEAAAIDADTPWACVGLDSVAIVGLSAELGEFLGCVVPPSAFFQFDTPAKLAAAPGLATGELETQEEAAPEDAYVDEHGEIKAECYDFEVFPEVLHLRGQLNELTDAGLVLPYLDVLTVEKKQQLNFNTYNYLGYASHPAVAQASKDAITVYGTGMSSSPIVGQNVINTELEAALCQHFDAEASILFVGGWVTNVTTIAALVGKGDLILCDILNHNSCVNGQRLSGATILAFPHNDVAAAERILKSVRHKYRRVLIVIEGVYSMDGDVPDLPAFVALKKQHKAILFVDEAHSFGTMGKTGKGMCEYFDVPTADVDVRMGTMSKALGSVGGFILASQTVVQYLKYSAGGFVYSVGLGPANAGAALQSVKLMGAEPQRSVRLQELSAFFYDACVEAQLDVGTNVRGACVVVVYIGGTVETVRLSMLLSEHDKINVKPIVHPAVEEGKCRLRFFISYLHTEEDLRRTVAALVRLRAHLQAPADHPAELSQPIEVHVAAVNGDADVVAPASNEAAGKIAKVTVEAIEADTVVPEAAEPVAEVEAATEAVKAGPEAAEHATPEAVEDTTPEAVVVAVPEADAKTAAAIPVEAPVEAVVETKAVVEPEAAVVADVVAEVAAPPTKSKKTKKKKKTN